ncbi:MAG: T9SS type A sorting domain-containing protein [Bacteroidia bacterium]|nr:T9SS type A sorting domain-containing protein [Bacteroidia bacterium]
MKTFYTIIFLCSFLPNGLFSQNFGQVSFPHSLGGAKMSDALTIQQHTVIPGSIMVAYQPISPAPKANFNSYNFVIDRTGPGGLSNNQVACFQKAYQVHANFSEQCDPKTRPVQNCSGVSIIETIASSGNLPIQAYYAFAGAYTDGCYFGLLDISGNCLYATSFLFPGRSYSHISKPLLMECPANPGEYIICGSMDKTMYAIRMNSNGNVLWSQLYPIEGEPKDIIPSAYGPNKNNECVIVGKTDLDFANNASDGFLMELNTATGAVQIFKRLHMPTNMNNPGNQYFNSVSLLSKEITNFNPLTYSLYGYIVGGYTEPFSGILHGNLLLYQVDSSLSHISLHIMSSLYDTTAGGDGEILDITSRRVNNNNKHVYYSLLKLDSGLSVLRTDRFISLNALSYREFHYPALNGEIEGCKINLVNDANQPNFGMQIYGTRSANSTLGNNLMTTYFNGVTSCESFTTITPFSQSPTSHLIDTITPFGNLQHCPNFMVTVTEDPAFMELCSAVNSVPGGSNSRTVYQAEELISLDAANIKLYPNPVKNKATLDYSLYEAGSVRIEIQNLLGQHIAVIENQQVDAGTYQTELNLSALGIEKGIYLINFETADERKILKLLFEGD